MKNHLTKVFFGLNNSVEFIKGLQHAIHQTRNGGIFTGDNLFTYNKNLSFLDDEKLMSSFKKHATSPVEQGILWRIALVVWGARNGLRLEGDFVECACYKGTTARIACDILDFAAFTNKHYYLYDLFDHDPSQPHHAMPEHSDQLFNHVKNRFADVPNAVITQGKVPDVLHDVAPDKIAFLHLDLNNADAEIGALELLFDRMVPGSILVLDDYGWLAYRAQKKAEDPWFDKRGYRVMELPTGQGILIK